MCALAGVALAQQPASRDDRAGASRLRYHVEVMERVLEQAVQHGAHLVGEQMQSVTPSMLLFAGPVRARGFRLAGYGVFFDVEVPALRESVTWSFRMLGQRDFGLEGAVELIRRHMQSLGDSPARTDLAELLSHLEGQLAPAATPGVEPRPAAVGTQAVEQPMPAPHDDDPAEVYTRELKSVLIAALLDHGSGMPLAAEEWLAVAARDAGERLAPGDLLERLTIMLRVRGRDLAAFRAGRLTREEARARVEEVREF